MFYRMKFDNKIGQLLAEAGLTTNAEKLNAWPAGLTAHLIKEGKSRGQDPITAAYLGFANFFANADTLDVSIRKRFVEAALDCATHERRDDLVTELMMTLAKLGGRESD